MAAGDSELQYATINLGRSQPVTLLQLVETLGRVLNHQPVIDFQPAQPGDMPHTYADITLARKLLHWEPKVELEEGLRGFVQWLCQN